MAHGYCNRILRIDLSKGSIIKEKPGSRFKRDYLGGMGFGARILYDEVKAGIDPLGPENVLIYALSPLTGTLVPSAGRVDITAKSPLTGIFGSANAGGAWAPELKYAGYDAIIVTGKAAEPVYIYIEDDKVELRKAIQVWGKDTFSATDAIRAELGDNSSDNVRVLVIGPAGENLVRFASIVVDYYHVAARSGLGAVMGSKNLKAIAVRGSGGVSVAHPERLEKAAEKATKIAKLCLGGWARGANLEHYKYCLPGKHYQTTIVPDWSKVSLEAAKPYMAPVSERCAGCTRGCIPISVKSGKYAGLVLGGVHAPEYTSWGGMCGIDNVPAIYKCSYLCKTLGMDIYDASEMIAFAIELYEKGIISENTTDGLALEWSNEEQIFTLLEKIALRDGFGSILAEGPVRAARKIGKGAEKLAVHVAGMAPFPYDPRPTLGRTRLRSIGTLTSPRGGDPVKSVHTATFYEYLPTPQSAIPEELGNITHEEFTDWWLENFLNVPHDVREKVYGNPPHLDPASYEGKVPLQVFIENELSAINALGVCLIQKINHTLLAELLSATTGEELSAAGLLKAGERLFTLASCFNAREGKTRNDFDWPERFYTEPVKDGPDKQAVLPRETVRRVLDEYFEYRGWNKETGVPGKQKLEELGLKDVAADLYGKGKS